MSTLLSGRFTNSLATIFMAIVIGVTQVFCYAPYAQGWAAIPLLTLFLIALPNKAPFRYAYAYGLAFFTHGTWWVYISIHTPSYGLDSKPLALLLSAAFIAWLALFPAVTAITYRYLQRHNPLTNAAVFASLWLLLEYGRSHFLTGYPWMALGDSQLSTPFSQWYPLIGSEGISWIIAFFAALFAQALRKQSLRNLCLTSSSFVLFLFLSLGLNHEWTHAEGSLKTIMVQNSVPLASKWQIQQHPKIIANYQASIRHALKQSPQLILLPEAALPHPSWINQAFKQIAQDASQKNTLIITGSPIFESNQAYNGAIAFGVNTGLYKKQHLVPFGEFWPMQSWLGENGRFFNIPMSMFEHGPSNQTPIHYTSIPLATFICYEITYPPLVRQSLQNSQLIITITDDAWFGSSIARDQHLEIARIRSKETGRAQAFVANTGITAAIDADGSILKQLNPDTVGQLEQALPLYQGQSPLLRYGNNWLYLLAIAIVFTRLAFQRSERLLNNTLPKTKKAK